MTVDKSKTDEMTVLEAAYIVQEWLFDLASIGSVKRELQILSIADGIQREIISPVEKRRKKQRKRERRDEHKAPENGTQNDGH